MMAGGIEKVCVIGAGVMGAGIAAQVANAGVRVLLLDVPAKDGADRDAVAKGAVAKMPVLGTPIGRPPIWSASSTVSPWSIAALIATASQYVPIRLAMKPGVSLARTMRLPMNRSTKSSTFSATAGSVCSPRTISTSRI